MAEHDEQKPSADESGPPVSGLAEHYRVRRQDWMAQADERARLRDEVRGSAEREALEIVTAARRDIRKIVVEARRELFVLSAQVQAAIGDAPDFPHSVRQSLAGPIDERETADDLSFAEEEWGLAPRATVKNVLEEARADMAVLASDARAVQARAEPSLPVPSVPVSPPIESSDPQSPEVVFTPLLSSPFHADEEPRARRSITPFIAVAAVAAIVVVLATAWSLRARTAALGSPVDTAAGLVAPAAIATSSDATSSDATSPATDAVGAGPSVRLSIEARRPAWIRAIVDGRPDIGQTLRVGEVYEFRGSQSIALRVGDAGAVLVSVNGEEPRPLGPDGLVLNRQFTVGPPAPSEPETADERETSEPADAAAPETVLPQAQSPSLPSDPPTIPNVRE